MLSASHECVNWEFKQDKKCNLDELQKRIQLYAMAFSFGATGMLTFTYGLLRNAGLPQVSFIAVFPAMIALWGLGSVIASWK